MRATESFESLRAFASACGRPLPEGATELLERFGSLLLRWNERINLTGARDERELVEDHYPDAVALASVVGHGALLDVGAGGGLPGLPFAILRPDVPVTLLEPRSRRAAFLRAAVHELGLTSVKVAEGRVELPSCRLPRGLPHRFAVVSSRATFPPEEWLRVGSRLVEPGGRVVLYLSGPPNAAWGAPVRTLSYTGRSGRERSLAVYAGAERST